MAAKNNVVDGLEGVPLVLLNFKMYETGKQVAKTQHVLATLNLVVSEKVFQSLPAEVQKVIEDLRRKLGTRRGMRPKLATRRPKWNSQSSACSLRRPT